MEIKEVFEKWRPELISYLVEMASFYDSPDYKEVLQRLSAFSARASLMRNYVTRSQNEKLVRFRIDEIDPFLVEVDRQFKIYSRLIAVNKFEWDTSN